MPRRAPRPLTLVGILAALTLSGPRGWAGQTPADILSLRAPAGPVERGKPARITFEPSEPCVVTVEIVDTTGAVVRSYGPRAAAGPAVLEWDLRFDGPLPVDEPEPGPLAPPGLYFARVRTPDETRARPFTVAPRYAAKKASGADYAATHHLSLQVRQLQSAMNATLLDLRAAETQAWARVNQPSGASMESARALVNSLVEIERDLLGAQDASGSTQVERGIGQRLTALARDLDLVDGKVSRDVRVRFNALRDEADRLRSQARQRATERLRDFNAAANEQGTPLVELPADGRLALQPVAALTGSAGAVAPAAPAFPVEPDGITALPPHTAAIQFDSKGVDFRPWLRRFIAQVKRNWLIPMDAMTRKGHVVITFVVQRDGQVTDIAVSSPSKVAVFNTAAQSALVAADRIAPLPAGYPVEHCVFTVTFYYNDSPLGR